MKQYSGEKIKDLRIAKGFTSQKEFAESIDMAPSQYGKFERGENSKRDTMTDLLTHFDMDIDHFYTMVCVEVRERLKNNPK